MNNGWQPIVACLRKGRGMPQYIYIYERRRKKSFLFFTYKRSLVVCEREGCWPYKQIAGDGIGQHHMRETTWHAYLMTRFSHLPRDKRVLLYLLDLFAGLHISDILSVASLSDDIPLHTRQKTNNARHQNQFANRVGLYMYVCFEMGRQRLLLLDDCIQVKQNTQTRTLHSTLISRADCMYHPHGAQISHDYTNCFFLFCFVFFPGDGGA